MKFLFLMTTFLSFFTWSQADYEAMVSLTERRVLFWNVRNYMEFTGPADFDSLFIEVTGGEFIAQNSNYGYVVPTDPEQRKTTVTLKGMRNRQAESIAAFEYEVMRLPLPHVYFGNNLDLQDDLNGYTDESLFHDRQFLVQYDAHTRTLLGIRDVAFKLVEWKVSVGEIEIIGKNEDSYQHLMAAVRKAKKGTVITFCSFKVLGPDGLESTLEVNTDYIKKGKRNEPIATYSDKK